MKILFVSLALLLLPPLAYADSGCKVSVAQIEHVMPHVQFRDYGGVEGGKLIGFMYAMPEIHGIPPADQLVVGDLPDGRSAILFVMGNCVTYATTASTEGVTQFIQMILGNAP